MKNYLKDCCFACGALVLFGLALLFVLGTLGYHSVDWVDAHFRFVFWATLVLVFVGYGPTRAAMRQPRV